MSTLRDELRAQVRLAVPVIGVNLGLMSMNIVDSAIIGHVSTAGLSAVSLGHAVLWVPLSFGVGLVMALDPLVSQAFGAKDDAAVARALQRGLVLALAVAVPLLVLLLLGADAAMAALDQPEELRDTAAAYTRITALGLPALLVFVALRRSLQALGRLRPIVWVTLLANVVNAAVDWALVRGEWGFPQLGARGCAVATTTCNVVMVVLLLAFTWRDLGPHLLPVRERVLALAPLGRMLKLGVPIGLALALEAGAFNAVTLVMGWFGTLELAANRVVLTLATASFMLPLGLSTAAAVRVGHAVGAGDPEGMRRAARVALGTGAVVMGAFALLFVAAPLTLLSAFTDDREVLELALVFVPLAAGFQLFDGLQVVAAGVLRGIGDTRVPMLVNLVGYWILALPLGTLAARRWGGGPQAMWWALGGGLLFAAVALVLRIRNRFAGEIAKLDVDGPDGPPDDVAAAGAAGDAAVGAAAPEDHAAEALLP